MALKSDGYRKLNTALTLTFPSTNRKEGRHAVLRIEDESSSTIIYEIELDAEQFTALMANSHTIVEANVIGADSITRVGKIMEHHSMTYPGWHEDGPSKGATIPEHVINAVAEQWRAENDWETVRVSRTNTGRWQFTGRRWVDPLDATGKD